MLVLIVSLTAQEVLDNMFRAWENVKDYKATLHAYTVADGKVERKTYDHRYLRPGYIYMKVLKGGSGAACYDPTTHKARGKKLFVKLTLDPDKDKRIQSIRGDKIYEAGIDAIVKRWKKYRNINYEGETTYKGIRVHKLVADGINHYNAVKEILYVRASDYLPVAFVQYDANGKKVKENYYENLKVNVGLKKKDVCF